MEGESRHDKVERGRIEPRSFRACAKELDGDTSLGDAAPRDVQYPRIDIDADYRALRVSLLDDDGEDGRAAAEVEDAVASAIPAPSTTRRLKPGPAPRSQLPMSYRGVKAWRLAAGRNAVPGPL
jgi:hypothetical protein